MINQYQIDNLKDLLARETNYVEKAKMMKELSDLEKQYFIQQEKLLREIEQNGQNIIGSNTDLRKDLS